MSPRAALEYSCSRQLPDGAWYYGEESRYHWIDSFHTGYNLDSIKCYIDSTGDHTFQTTAGSRISILQDRPFFEPWGRPRYYHNRAYPIDIQCAAQGIETLAKFADHDPECAADGPEGRTVDHPDTCRIRAAISITDSYPLLVARIPMLHWGQATMYRALALLLLKVEHESRSVGSMPLHA